MPAVETPGRPKTHRRGVYTGPGARREAAPPSTERAPASKKDTRDAAGSPRRPRGTLKDVDEECAAEVDGLHLLSAEPVKMTGSLDDLKSTMTTFWQPHDVIDEKERRTYNAAVTIQKLFRRFSCACAWRGRRRRRRRRLQLETWSRSRSSAWPTTSTLIGWRRLADVNVIERATAARRGRRVVAGDLARRDDLAGSRLRLAWERVWRARAARGAVFLGIQFRHPFCTPPSRLWAGHRSRA